LLVELGHDRDRRATAACRGHGLLGHVDLAGGVNHLDRQVGHVALHVSANLGLVADQDDAEPAGHLA